MRNCLFICLIGIIAFAFSCSSEQTQNDDTNMHNHLIQPTVELTYEYNMYVPQEYWFMKGIDGESFISKLFKKTAQGELTAFYPFTTTAYPEGQAAMTFSQESQSAVPVSEMTHLVFDEEWAFDSAQNKMIKKVKNYSLVRSQKTQDSITEIKKTLLATYNCDEAEQIDTNDSHVVLLGTNIAYEVAFDNQIFKNSFDNFPTSHVVQVLTDNILSGKHSVYVFTSRDPLQKMTPQEVRESLGEEIKESEYYFEDSDSLLTEYDTVRMDYSEIKGFAFIEDWYINTNNMSIYKIVKGYAPVREYPKMLEEDYYELVRTIPCLLLLSDSTE
ncbi:MAG: hypothetical protein PF481_04915 [Bacteroidales bacterium]|jgi:hypothetical protein|nr:hypothetical protein [Bacteroidales bacterium]